MTSVSRRCCIIAAALAASLFVGGALAGDMKAEIASRVIEPCARDFVYWRLARAEPTQRERELREHGGFDGLVGNLKNLLETEGLADELAPHFASVAPDHREAVDREAVRMCFQSLVRLRERLLAAEARRPPVVRLLPPPNERRRE